jgi:hypothetical protein
MDAATGACVHTSLEGGCNDANACTTGESCANTGAVSAVEAPPVGAVYCTSLTTTAIPNCNIQAFDQAGNLAQVSPTGAKPAVASSTIADGALDIHLPANLNDGHYGNGSSWIPNQGASWIKIDLGSVQSVGRVRFGRDRLAGFSDRPTGRVKVALALADDVYANGNSSNDALEYAQVFDSAGSDYSGELAKGETVELTFAPRLARFIKLSIELDGACIDELEVFAGTGPACAGGAPASCNDGNECTTDGCNPSTGCQFTPVSGACDDDNSCTQGDTCAAGECSGTPLPCEDDDPCTVDNCVPGAGCVSTLSGAEGCEPGIHGVAPSAVEAGVTREFTILGAGLTKATNVSIPGMAVLEWNSNGQGGLWVKAHVPPTAGVFSVVVDTPNGVYTAQEAIVSKIDGFCGGTSCGACAADIDCLDGDRCSADRCSQGLCRHEALASCCPEGGCGACEIGGDVDANGAVTVTDVQCTILTVLWTVGGKTGPMPVCAAVPLTGFDRNCSKSLNVADIQIVIANVLNIALDPAVASNGNGCPDACTSPKPVACAADVVAYTQTKSTCSASVTASAAGADACFPAVLSLAGPGMTSSTCIGIHPNGTESSCVQKLTLVDNKAPNIACGAPVQVECTGPCATDAQPNVDASDDCSETAVSCAGPQGLYCRGTNTATCTATDASGNAASCPATVNVVDTVAPVPVCRDLTYGGLGPSGMATMGSVLRSVHDGCDALADLTIVQTPAPGTLVAPGDHSVTVEVSDASGNTSSCAGTFRASADAVYAPPYGWVSVTQPAGAVNGNPCKSGPAPVPFPGTQFPVTVTACYTPDFASVVSVDYRAAVQLPPVGQVELTGVYDANLDKLCLTGAANLALGPGAPVAISNSHVVACLVEGGEVLSTLEFRASLGTELGSTEVTGGYSTQTGALCMAGALEASLLDSSLSGVAEVCLSYGVGPFPTVSAEFSASAILPPFGVAHLSGNLGGPGPSCIHGEVVGNPQSWLPVALLSILELEASACLGNGGFGAVALRAIARLGQGSSAALLELNSSLTGSQGVDFAVTLAQGCQSAAGCGWAPNCPSGQTCTATWKPFSDIPTAPSELRELALSTVSGLLALAANGPNLDISASVGGPNGSVPLITGPVSLNLDQAAVKARLVSTDNGLEAKFYLGGQVSLPLEQETLLASVEGQVSNEGIQLVGVAGSADGATTIEPLSNTVGLDVFRVNLENATSNIHIDFANKSALANVKAGVSFELFESVLSAALDITISFGAGGTQLVAAAFLEQLTISLGEWDLDLGGMGTLILALSGSNLDAYAFDEDGDPSNGKESTVALKLGLNLIARAEIPFVQEFLPGAAATVAVRVKSKTSIEANATLDLPLTLIKPEDNVPGINMVRFDKVGAGIRVSGKFVELSLGGAVTFQQRDYVDTIDGDPVVYPPIQGNANLLLDVVKPIAFGGEIFVDGLWIHPFGFPNYAALNPGLLVKFTLAKVAAVPVPVPVSVGFNGQIFYKKSGEWPVEFELDQQNNPVNLPPNFFTVGASMFLQLAPTPSGLCLLPGVKCMSLPTIMGRFNFQNMFLQDFVHIAESLRSSVVHFASFPGLEQLLLAIPDAALAPIDISPLDIRINNLTTYLSTHNVTKFGQRYTAGIRAIFDADVTDLLGVKRAALFDGYLSPTGIALTAQMSPIDFIPGLEVTGDPHRRQAALGGGAIEVPHSADLAEPRTVEAWIRTPSEATIAAKRANDTGLELLVGPLAPEACDENAPSCPNSHTLVARIYGEGQVRELVSNAGVIKPNTTHHVALTLAGDGNAALYVDGSVAEHSDSAPLLLPATNTAPFVFGEGLTRIDDVRVWTVARMPADLKGNARMMPFGFRFDPTLALRLEFDYDLSTTTAHNSRIGGSTGHGTYVGGATSVVEPGDQDIYLKLAFGLDYLLNSYFWLQSGLAVDWDPPIAGATFSAASQVSLGKGKADGTLYTRNLPLLGFQEVGGIYITGNGPNAVKGDFDDGLYLSGDLMASPAPTLNASGRLLFQDKNQQVSEVAEAAILFDCLDPAGCDSVLDYTLRTQGAFDLKIPDPQFGDFRVQGEHLFDSDEQVFHVDGSLTAFGRTFLSGDLTVWSNGVSFSSAVDLDTADLGIPVLTTATEMDLDLTFDPPKLCASGANSVVINGFGSFDGELDFCLGSQSYASFSAVGSAAINGIPLANVDITLSNTSGLQINKATLKIPGIFDGEVSGYFNSSSDFHLTGTSTVGFPHLVSLQSTVTLTPAGVEAAVALNPGCPSCVVQASMVGAILHQGGAWSYDIQGAGVVRLGGFELSSATVRVSSAEGIRASGTVNLGIASANVAGALDTNTGAFQLAGNYAASPFAGVSAQGNAVITNSGAQVSGQMGLWGSTGSYSGAIVGAGAAPPSFSLSSQMDLNVPMSGGAVTLNSSTVTLASTAGAFSASVQGNINWPGISATLSGALTNTSYSLSGGFSLGLPGAPVGSATFTLTPQQLAFSASTTGSFQSAVSINGKVATSQTSGLTIDGSVKIGITSYASTAIAVTPNTATFTSSMGLGTVSGVSLGQASATLTVDFTTLSVCGTGSVPFPLDSSKSCTLDLCLGGNGPPTVDPASIYCDGFCIGDFMCGENQFCDLLFQCWNKKANDEPCGGLIVGDRECQSGFCDIWKAFPAAVCATPLPDGVGCVDGGSCISGYCGARPGSLEFRCFTPWTQRLGEECFDPGHCALGTCWGTPTWPSQCLCQSNAECAVNPTNPSNYVCKLGTWGVTPLSGLCIPPLAAGQACIATSECQPGLSCHNGICIAPASKGNYELCLDSAECINGSCWGTPTWPARCLCTDNSGCTGGTVCNLGPWGFDDNGLCIAPRAHGQSCSATSECQPGLSCQNGTCIAPASKGNNELCLDSAECINGSCWGTPTWPARCLCTDNSGCTGGTVCNLGPWGFDDNGLCMAPRALGQSCAATSECQGGLTCAGGLCIAPASKVNQQLCTDTAECINGVCWGTPTWPARCLCTDNNGCTGGSVCKLGDWGITPESGFCIAPRGVGQGCWATSECAGGLACQGGVCVQPASKHNWQGCTSNSECIQGECWGGVCRCSSHSHCTNDPAFGGDSYCDMGTWFLGNQEGRCYAGKKASNVAERCEDGAWCQSGLCTYSLPLAFSTCYTHAGWPASTPCHVDQQCASNWCNLFTGYRCN